ncbi:hypothetical protein [Flavobacterium sp.]|uniref:hypothetical protein n=1 Tax=Flavobacterium sp. TaxID=239 RepID=UPI00286CCAEB|nr:hypothetical protein [Flavobacterium sp.]
MKNQNLNHILLWLFAIAIGLLLNSCDVMKTSEKSKSDTSLKDSFEQRSFRKGDSVSFRPGKTVFKDTTIYRITKNNTRLETVYDSNGNIRDINCYTDKIEELTRRNIALDQSLKEKQSTKKEEFDSTFILYIIGGVVVLGMFALFLMFLYIKKNTAVVTQFLNK